MQNVVFESREEADYRTCQFKLEKDNSTHCKKKIKDLSLDLIKFKEMVYFQNILFESLEGTKYGRKIKLQAERKYGL